VILPFQVHTFPPCETEKGQTKSRPQQAKQPLLSRSSLLPLDYLNALQLAPWLWVDELQAVALEMLPRVVPAHCVG
jgi:hypothetical protein